MRPQSFVILVVALSACGGKATKKQPVPPAVSAPTAPATPAAATTVPASPNVGVSDDLAKQCSLRFARVETAPKFDFNATELQQSDRDVLQQVAECLTRGPLQGRTVQLVGHADPRGTEEYNLGLGSRRAESVRAYLHRLGVPPNLLSPTTRGEVDANGNDESGWQRDRRVDLQLVN